MRETVSILCLSLGMMLVLSCHAGAQDTEIDSEYFAPNGAYQGESSTVFDDDAGAAYTEFYGADGGFQGEVDSYVDDQ